MQSAVQHSTRVKISQVLVPYVRRNRNPGYAQVQCGLITNRPMCSPTFVQGMNFITALLLACMSEEDAFWVLCTIVEDLRDPDFYSRPPAAMNGFVAESSVLGQVM